MFWRKNDSIRAESRFGEIRLNADSRQQKKQLIANMIPTVKTSRKPVVEL